MVDSGQKDLAGSGINAEGAMAILNIGSFNTFTAAVKSHSPGQNFFTYDDKFGDIKFKPGHNQYFLEDELDFLDNAGEWFYYQVSKTVHVKTIGWNVSWRQNKRKGDEKSLRLTYIGREGGRPERGEPWGLGTVHANTFSFENAYISMRSGLLSTPIC